MADKHLAIVVLSEHRPEKMVEATNQILARPDEDWMVHSLHCGRTHKGQVRWATIILVRTK